MAGLNGKYAEIGKIHQGSDTKVCILNVNNKKNTLMFFD